MSDTKITAEERALWASVATARINAVTPERQCEITAQVRLVKALKAIEQTEARAEKAEARVKSRNNHIHRLLGEALENERNLDGMKSRWQTAEAGNARLSKMVDWLAELVFDRPCAYACCPFDKHRPTGPDDDDCDKTHIQCWAEAARLAVADSEVKACQN